MEHFLDLTVDADAEGHQRRRGSYDNYAAARAQPVPEGLGDSEIEFLSQRDSFYLASVGVNGWPYVQHRGGPSGFVKVVDPSHLAWAERSGNRQYITAGHVDHDDRVAIIAVDYPNRQRLKLLGHARFEPDPAPGLLERIGIDGRLEGLVTVEVVAYDWNCPKYITPRFTAGDIRAVIQPLQQRIQQLEAALSQVQHQPPITIGALP
ncbi:MAG TPA: pyridoxamine 5'-phosphate oxidase family protein [Acidimicrobiales bacterium]|nr:pyridoxamine 5'-phosphate oxidase family protein [Acidimicrobiales bacterium]